MSEKMPVTPEQIQSAVVPMGRHEAEMILMRRDLEARESSLFTDNRFIWASDPLGEDHGDGDISHGVRHFFTDSRLNGAAARLNKGTIVKSEGLTLPDDTSFEGVRAFVFDRSQSLPHITLSRIALFEGGGFFHPIKTEFEGFFTSESKDNAHIEGLGKYLNDSQDTFIDASEITERIAEARGRLDEISRKAFESLERAWKQKERKN
jgi:hypothetical protein